MSSSKTSPPMTHSLKCKFGKDSKCKGCRVAGAFCSKQHRGNVTWKVYGEMRAAEVERELSGKVLPALQELRTVVGKMKWR